jgi:hypothetical protein
LIAALVAAPIATASQPAHAYRFAVRARTMAQVYQLRGFRLVGADVLYARRRFGQSLSLSIWDIGDLAARRRTAADPDGRRGGPTISWTSHLRLDHEFGSWANGNDTEGAGALIDALDLIPELDESVLALDLLYGYLTIDHLLRDRVTIKLGRQLNLDGFDAWAIDGATVTVRTPLPIAIEATAGLRVRDTSPIAPAAVELDGTSGADCREYVEGAAPGEGHWQLIDRSMVVDDRPLASDQMFCPQRDQLMPTAGIAIATRGLRRWSARLSYRRTDSSTVGLIGPVDRLDFDDTGLYPDEANQAPARAVNEERIAATARAEIRAGTRMRIAPWAHARASLVHRLIDRGSLGADLMIGDDHVITPEITYRVPTWDADSIFNVFEVLPTTDLKLGWTGPDLGATAWLRRYHGGDDDEAGAAYGVDVEAERALDERWTARVSAIGDGGWGGTRFGATATASYGRRLERDRRIVATASLAGWRFDPDDDDGARERGAWWEGIAQARVSWAFVRAALHGVVETTTSREQPIGVRLMGVLDLAFEPEM